MNDFISQKLPLRWLLLSGALFLFFPFLLTAQAPVLQSTALDFQHPVLEKSFAAYSVYQLDYQQLHGLVQPVGRTEVILKFGDDYLWNVQLDAHDIRAPHYREVAGTADGPRVLPRRPNITYRGMADADRSLVRFSITPEWCLGMIDGADATYFIEPIHRMVDGVPDDYYIVYEANDVLTDPEAHCAYNAVRTHAPPPRDPQGQARMDCMEAELATAGDFGMFTRYGSVQAVNDFIITVTNNMEPLYDDFNLDYLIVDQFVPNSAMADPWTNSDEAFTILDDFGPWATANMLTHDVGQIWVTRDIQGCGSGPDNFTLIGCARNIGNVCGAQRYNICEDFSNSANCLRALSAHELGHTWDGVHSEANNSTIMWGNIVCGATTWTGGMTGNITRIQNHIDSRDCLSACGTNCTIDVGAISVDEGCPNANDGSISALISGENNPVSYTLTGPVNGANNTGFFPNLSPGNYILRAIDGLYNETCFDEVDVTINSGVDNTPPVAVCKNITVELGPSGQESIEPADIDNGSSDNCGIVSATINGFNEVLVLCANVGQNNMVQLEVFDGEGNSHTCLSSVTVEDNIDPSVSCSGLNFTTPNDPGLCTATLDLPVPLAIDNCSVASLAFRYRLVDNSNTPLGPWLVGWTDQSFNNVTLDVGRYRVRWRVRDPSGNQDFCRYFVRVNDVEPPTINCFDQVIVFDGEESIPLLVDDLATATDNCGIASLTLDINEIFCEQLGDEITVTATAVDDNGLMNSCTSTVTVDGLPCGWSDQPIGCDGNTTYDVPTETFSLTSDDCHNAITSGTDEYAFAAYNLCGNGSITAEVTSIEGSSNGWAGVMMRENVDPMAKSVAMSTNLSSNHRREVRYTPGGNVTSQLKPAFNRHWLRITRTGNSFRIYASSNGIAWFLRSSQTVFMQECIEVGLVLNGYLGSNDITATFENVVVIGTTFFELQAIPPADLAHSQKNFTVFPNPTTGRVTIALDNLLEQEARLEVLDVNGRVVQLVREGILENSTEELNIGQLPPGLYFIRLQLADGTVQMQRVVLQP